MNPIVEGFLTTVAIPMALRWVHVLAGVAWIGHLWYFNLVQGAMEKSLDAAAKRAVVPANRGRALWWFRWGAMITFLTGALYLIWEQFVAADTGFRGWFSDGRNWWITMGAIFGTVMWFNVWHFIWPRQRRLLAAVSAGETPADMERWAAVAGRFSRINFYLSVPMFFGMLGRQHFPIGNEVPVLSAWMAGVIAVGFAIAHVALHGLGPRVGREFLKG